VTETERFTIADHVFAQLKQHGVAWRLQNKLTSGRAPPNLGALEAWLYNYCKANPFDPIQSVDGYTVQYTEPAAG